MPAAPEQLPAATQPTMTVPVQPAVPEPAVPEPAAPATAPATPVTGPVGAAVSGEQNGDMAAAEADAATAIQVRGLSSFGAITSFKQSLERVDGIHGVTLGLGPSGEFVYTATHAPSIDLDAAIRSIEGNAEIERDGGTLRVRVGRKAG